MNDYKKCSIGDILLDIHERQWFFFKSDTMEMVRPFDYLNNYLLDKPTDEDYKKLPSLESLNIYQFPSYEYINHKL